MDIVGSQTSPQWLEESEGPIRTGGRIAFTLAYFLGLFTVLYIARAYKSFTRKVRRGQTVAIHTDEGTFACFVSLDQHLSL